MTAGTAYLDVGCGSGMAAQLATSRGAKVSGIDASDALLAIAGRRVPDGDFHLADLEQLPFAEKAFDPVTGFNSFQYAGNPMSPYARRAGSAQALAQGRICKLLDRYVGQDGQRYNSIHWLDLGASMPRGVVQAVAALELAKSI